MKINWKFWTKLSFSIAFGILLAKIIEFLLLTFIGYIVIMLTGPNVV